MAEQPRQTESSKPPAPQPGTAKRKATGHLDLRKQLYNDRKIGLIEDVQLPTEMITHLWGILLDIDPHLFHDTVVPQDVKADPAAFYDELVAPWLQRHPVLQDAEVLVSGRGLHVIIWLDEGVALTSDGDRQRWAGIVQAAQALLPSDPDAPGLTALTRARGSINSKNNVNVTTIHMGKPIPVQAVIDLFEQLRACPFRTVCQILFGSDRVRPCPVCGGDDTTLSALDYVGQCYGSCGKVELARLYDIFLAPRPTVKKRG